MNPRLRRQPSPPNPRSSPEEYYSQRYDTDDLIFSMSLPESASNAQQGRGLARRGGRHNPRLSTTELQRSTRNSSSSSGSPCHSSVLFSCDNASVTQNSMTSVGSEGFAQFQPQRHPVIPHRPPQPQPPPHANPQTRRVLTAADFSSRYPCQSASLGI